MQNFSLGYGVVTNFFGCRGAKEDKIAKLGLELCGEPLSIVGGGVNPCKIL